MNYRKLSTTELRQRMTSQNHKPREVYLILNNIRSLLNVGAIFRTADAAGVKKIFLCGITAYPPKKLIKWIDKVDSPDIELNDEGMPVIRYEPSKKCVSEFLHKEIGKTALGTLDQMQWEYSKDAVTVINKLKENKINIIGLEQTKESVDYRKVDYKKPLAIIVGNETAGIRQEVLEHCDQVAEIPMHGVAISLNVATSAGIILYKAIEK